MSHSRVAAFENSQHFPAARQHHLCQARSLLPAGFKLDLCERDSKHGAWPGLRIALTALLALLPAAAQDRPNFLFILVDDLGWSDLGAYGSDLHRTPSIDALADEGLRFTNAYAASPVCTPTRASILTGKHPAKLRMTIWREAAKRPPLDRPLQTPRTRDSLPHAEVTVAEVLRAAGYTTAHVGKWHLGTAEYYPETQGFDYNVGGTLWGLRRLSFSRTAGHRRTEGCGMCPTLPGVARGST